MGDVIPNAEFGFVNHAKYDHGRGKRARNGEELPEITSIRQAVREWPALDSNLDGHARPKFARPIILDGASAAALTGGAINRSSGFSTTVMQKGRCQVQVRRMRDSTPTDR
jgi:hypothetical protein